MGLDSRVLFTKMRLQRQRLGLSQDKLGKAVGIPQPIVSLIEIGRLRPTPNQAERLSRILSVDVAELQNEVTP